MKKVSKDRLIDQFNVAKIPRTAKILSLLSIQIKLIWPNKCKVKILINALKNTVPKTYMSDYE